jgi:hypothetical protein
MINLLHNFLLYIHVYEVTKRIRLWERGIVTALSGLQIIALKAKDRRPSKLLPRPEVGRETGKQGGSCNQLRIELAWWSELEAHLSLKGDWWYTGRPNSGRSSARVDLA